MSAIVEPVACMLRPAAGEDESFLLEVITAARMADPQFLRCTSDQQQAIVRFELHIRTQAIEAIYPKAITSIILVGGERAGQLVVNRDADGIRLIDVELLPRFRGNGIGTRIVQSLCDEAATHDVPLSLRVALDNRGAQRLYERMGFGAVAIDGGYLEMVWTAS